MKLKLYYFFFKNFKPFFLKIVFFQLSTSNACISVRFAPRRLGLVLNDQKFSLVWAVMGRFESQKWIVKSRILRFESQMQNRTLNFWRITFYWIGLLFFLQESDSWKRFFWHSFFCQEPTKLLKENYKLNE